MQNFNVQANNLQNYCILLRLRKTCTCPLLEKIMFFLTKTYLLRDSTLLDKKQT